MSDSPLVDLLIVAIGAVVVGLFSYFDLPMPKELGPHETRASRAAADSYTYAVIVGAVFTGDRIGEANHALRLGSLLGALSGGILAVLTRDLISRLLAGAARGQ